jgi:hypothetical protein
MRQKARSLQVFLFGVFCMVVSAAPAFADITAARTGLIEPNPNPGEKFPLQGACGQWNINEANPGIDLKSSTWSCPGDSARMMRVYYREGPQECVYIDNTFRNAQGGRSSLFVPLQSSEEWLAFKANLPGGIRLTYGCPGVLLTNACGTQIPLPDQRASNTPYVIELPDGYKAEYICPYGLEGGQVLDHGCGEWQRVRVISECKLPGGVAPSTPGGGASGTLEPLLPGKIQPIAPPLGN